MLEVLFCKVFLRIRYDGFLKIVNCYMVHKVL